MNKLLEDVIAICEQERLDILGEEGGADVIKDLPQFVLLDEIKKLRRIGEALIHADERGQGLPWQEAMKALSKALGYEGGKATSVTELAKDVDTAFTALSKVCPHKDQTDCGHPDIEFSSMVCSPANCPLLDVIPDG